MSALMLGWKLGRIHVGRVSCHIVACILGDRLQEEPLRRAAARTQYRAFHWPPASANPTPLSFPIRNVGHLRYHLPVWPFQLVTYRHFVHPVWRDVANPRHNHVIPMLSRISEDLSRVVYPDLVSGQSGIAASQYCNITVLTVFCAPCALDNPTQVLPTFQELFPTKVRHSGRDSPMPFYL